MNHKRRSSSNGRLRTVTHRKQYKADGIFCVRSWGNQGSSTRQKIKEFDRRDLDNW